MQNDNNFCKVYIFFEFEGKKVWVGGVVDREKVNGWQHSGIKTGAILPTVASLVHVQWSFFATNMHPNNINETNKRETLWRKDTRMPMCALMCVRVRACARRCVRVCACVGEGFTFAFLFAWVRACGCVRVCVCACGWGGVQGRRPFGAGAGALDMYDTPGTQRDKLFTTPLYRTPRGISCLPQPQGSLPRPLYHNPLPNPRLLYLPPRAVWRLFAFLWVTLSFGYLIGFSGGWVLMGGVFFW